MTGPVSLEEWADQRVRDWADQPMDFSGLEAAPHIAGTLHMAAPGDSISSIMGSSNPGAVGAFMQANDLNGTAIRAGQRYLVPEQDSFAAPGANALGQAGLDADNARATQRAQDRLDGSMTAIANTVSGFDPMRGLLATKPDWDFQHGAAGSWSNESAGKYHQASNAVDIAGKVLDGYEIQNRALGLLDGGRAVAKIGRVTGPLGAVLVPLEHGLEGISEVKKGAPIAPVVAGVVGKTAVQGTGILGGMLVGSAATAWFPPLIPVGAAVGGFAGGWATGKALNKTSNEAFGHKVQAAMEAAGRYPYYDGGVGWPVFPGR